jgi:hypothetical protein
MKKLFVLFVLILNSCTPTEIEETKPILKTCYDIVGYHDGDIDYIIILVNGKHEKYQVPNIKDYYRTRICDLSSLKKI